MDHGADSCQAALESPLGYTCPVEIKLFCWIEMSVCFFASGSNKEKSCQQLRAQLASAYIRLQRNMHSFQLLPPAGVTLAVVRHWGGIPSALSPGLELLVAAGPCPDIPWCLLSSCHMCHCQWLQNQAGACCMETPAQLQLQVLLP